MIQKLNKIPFKEYKTWFYNYTNNYKKDKEIANKALLKIDHTERVIKLSEEIYDSLHPETKEDNLADLVNTCALFHDIGRFWQVKENKTFWEGNQKIDHGKKGVEILKLKNILSELTKYQKDIIYNAIEYHNKLEVPHFSDHYKEICSNIIRDADKLDIINIMINNYDPKKGYTSGCSKETLLNIFNKSPVDISNNKTHDDAILTRIGFGYDLHYKKSIETYKTYLPKLLNMLSDKSHNREIEEHISGYLKQRVKA